DDGQRQANDGKGGAEGHHREPGHLRPGIKTAHRRRAPEAFLVPERRGAVDRSKQRAHDADAAPGDNVDLDAGFLERAQSSGVIGARRPGAGQDERGSKMWRVGFGDGRRGLRKVRHSASSWMVTSFSISNSRVPPGVTTFTVSPGSLLRNARPIGDVVEIRPFDASASSGMTS